MTSTVFPGARAAKCPFDPPPAIQSLQDEAPLHRVRLPDGTTPWLVTRYADQKALLSDPRVSADVTKPGYPSQVPVGEASGAPISFILMDDPEHARLRRRVTAPFAIKRVEAMRPGVQKIVDDLIDELLGAKIAHPGEDLLSGLVERIEKGELTRADAAQMGVLMLIAGHETTANMIALGTLALLEHPAQGRVGGHRDRGHGHPRGRGHHHAHRHRQPRPGDLPRPGPRVQRSEPACPTR